MNTVFDDMLRLLSEGFAPYTGKVEDNVYVGFGCKTIAAARWMHRNGVFVCLGCSKQCNQAGHKGFELVKAVPVGKRRLAFAVLPAVSAEELLDKKKLLTIQEVEFILNISRTQVYCLLQEGVLDRHPDLPTRITVESARKEAERRRIG